MKNYYDILGVAPTATSQEIKDAYKKLAQKFHPDVNNNDDFFSEAFKNINEAKETLLDKERRSDYDFKARKFASFFDSIDEEDESYQSTEDALNHKHRQQSGYRKSSVLKNVFIIACLILVGAAGYFLAINKNIFQTETTTGNDLEAMTIEVLKDSSELQSKNISQVELNELPKAVASETTEPTITKSKTKEDAPAKKMTSPTLEKKIESKAEQNLTATEMTKILKEINAGKTKFNSNSNCVQIRKTTGSNIKNAFDIAEFLKNHGFVVSGRALMPGSAHGVQIDASGECIKIIMGSL